MSGTGEAQTDSTDATKTSDRQSSLSLSRRGSFDPFQYITTWTKELHLPYEPGEGREQEAESDVFSFLPHVDEENPEFLEKRAREREELIKAKDRLSTAEKLRQDGYLLESILFCGPILRQEIGKWIRPVRYDDYGTILMRQCILQLLLVFCQRNTDALYRHREDYFPIKHSKFLAEVVEQEYHAKTTALLCVLRDICGYRIIENWGLEVQDTQDTLQNILDIMQSIYPLDDPETLLALKYLAESFVFDGYQGNSFEVSIFSAKREISIRRHSLQIRRDLGPYDPACLRYDHAMARVLLNNGKLQDAKNVLRDIFDRRETAFGELHLESQRFIDRLLDDYCENYEGEPSDRHKDFFDCLFIDNLIEFCIKRKAYNEADTLAQECVFPREDTNSASKDEVFRKWGHFKVDDPIPKIQPRLASYQTPMWGWFWEDSRMYFCTWDQVILRPEYPEDPFPRAPIRLFVSDGAISIDTSGNCLADFVSMPEADVKSGPTALIHNSEIWQLLESKRLSGDWKILLALSPQKCYCAELIQGTVNHLFWLFWDEVIEKNCVTSTKDTISHSKVPYSRTYRFRNLDVTKSEWLIVNTTGMSVCLSQENLDPHEPIPGDANGHYVEKNEFSSFLGFRIFPQNKLKIPGMLRYHIYDPRKNYININVPFVPYEHFRSSRAYREGLSYVEYFEFLREKVGRDDERSNMKRRWCDGKLSGRQELPIWYLSGSTAMDYRMRGGYFNGIPTGLCAIADHIFPEDGFNMVSSDWFDWKSFTLHKVDSKNAPFLQLPSGQSINCQGCITGTWTEDGQLSRQWSGLSFFVMDCDFSEPGSNERRNFVITSAMLAKQNLHIMSGPEKRFFCGKISISLFRYAPAEPRIGASVWRKKPKKTKETAVATVEESFWGEMNRREKWDRDFETRLKIGPPEPSELVLDRGKEKEFRQKWPADMEAEKETEDTARREWDARYRASAKQQLLS